MAYRVIMKDELQHGLFSFGKKKEEPKPQSVRELALQREQRIKNDRARRSQDMAVEGIIKKINGLAAQINPLIKQYNALVNDYKSKGYENTYGPITAKLSNTSESWFTSLFHEDGWIKFDTSLSELQRKLGPRKLATGSGLKAQIKSIIASDLKDTRAGEIGLNPATDIDIKIDGNDVYYRINRTSLKKARGR